MTFLEQDTTYIHTYTLAETWTRNSGLVLMHSVIIIITAFLRYSVYKIIDNAVAVV